MGVVERASLRSLYLYLVCLVTLVLAVFALANVVRDAVRLAYPDPGYYGVAVPAPVLPGGQPDQASKVDLQRQQQAARDSQRHEAVLSLVGSATMLLVAGPLYLYHWRRVQAEVSKVQPGATPDPDASRSAPGG